MRILFVRHGHPDYKKDCLTDIGKQQAAAVAKRLAEEGIDKLFCSTMGRARETASYISEELGLEAEPLDFIREISWGSEDGSPLPWIEKGYPWQTSRALAAHGLALHDPSWKEKEPFRLNTRFQATVQRVLDGCDPWLASLGIIRDGLYYRLQEPKYETVCVVSHGGSSTVVLSHMLNLEQPFLFGTLTPRFTSVTELRLEPFTAEEPDGLIVPFIELINDSRHIWDCWMEE